MSFARAFAALTGASAISIVAQLLRGKIAALFLGPAGVGLFNQISLAWNIAQVAGGLGCSHGVVQHGAEALAKDDHAALKRLASTMALLLGASSLAIALAGAIFAPAISGWLLNDGGSHANLVRLVMLAVPIGVSAQLWRALLSAGQAVSAMVRAQIASDLLGAAVFAVLVVWKGLEGAIIGFLVSHVLLFLALGLFLRRQLGADLVRPQFKDFDWAVVRSNLGFGASGLFLVLMINLAVLLVSQMLIGRFGAEANGYFANAWRIASVYLGAATATMIGYYLASLARAPDHAAMGKEVNVTLRFFLIILPPIMAGIMVLGEWIVWLILSSAFVPVAPLLLLMVPAELARIGCDTVMATYLARRRLGPFTLVYGLQSALFVGLAWLLVSTYGVTGAALAYFCAMTASFALALVVCVKHFALRIEVQTIRLAIFSMLMIGGVAAVATVYPIGYIRLAAGIVFGLVWLPLVLREDDARRMVPQVLARFRD